MTPTLPFAMMNVFFIFIVPVALPFVRTVLDEMGDGNLNLKFLVAELTVILDSTINSVEDKSGVTE